MENEDFLKVPVHKVERSKSGHIDNFYIDIEEYRTKEGRLVIKQKEVFGSLLGSGDGVITIWINVYIASMNEWVLMYLKHVCNIQMMIQLLKKSKKLNIGDLFDNENMAIFCADDDGNLPQDHGKLSKLDVQQNVAKLEVANIYITKQGDSGKNISGSDHESDTQPLNGKTEGDMKSKISANNMQKQTSCNCIIL